MDFMKTVNDLNDLSLFNFAEQLYESGKLKEALTFYQSFVNSDLTYIPIEISIAHYRIFLLSLGNNAEENWGITQRFTPFIRSLPDGIKLDALLKVARLCLSLHKYIELGIYADQLRACAHFVYMYSVKYKDVKFIRDGDKKMAPNFPLVVYWGQGYLLKERSLSLIGHYEEAKEFTKGYANLDWFEITDDDTKVEIEKFKTFAKGNTFLLELFQGNVNVLDDFVDFIASQQYKPNLLSGILTLVEAANMHGYDIDHILGRYANEIETYQHSENTVWRSQFYRYSYQRAIYECHKGRFQTGINEIIRSFAYAGKNNHTFDFEKCAKLYWRYRAEASSEQEKTFSTIMGGVLV